MTYRYFLIMHHNTSILNVTDSIQYFKCVLGQSQQQQSWKAIDET